MINETKFKIEDFHLVCGWVYGNIEAKLFQNSIDASTSLTATNLTAGYIQGFELKVNNITFGVTAKIVNENFHFKKLEITGDFSGWFDLESKPLSYLLEKIEEAINAE